MDLWPIAACKLQCLWTPEKSANPGPSTIEGIEIVRFCAFAPPDSPLRSSIRVTISTAESGIKSIASPLRVRHSRMLLAGIQAKF